MNCFITDFSKAGKGLCKKVINYSVIFKRIDSCDLTYIINIARRTDNIIILIDKGCYGFTNLSDFI